MSLVVCERPARMQSGHNGRLDWVEGGPTKFCKNKITIHLLDVSFFVLRQDGCLLRLNSCAGGAMALDERQAGRMLP